MCGGRPILSAATKGPGLAIPLAKLLGAPTANAKSPEPGPGLGPRRPSGGRKGVLGPGVGVGTWTLSRPPSTHTLQPGNLSLQSLAGAAPHCPRSTWAVCVGSDLWLAVWLEVRWATSLKSQSHSTSFLPGFLARTTSPPVRPQFTCLTPFPPPQQVHLCWLSEAAGDQALITHTQHCATATLHEGEAPMRLRGVSVPRGWGRPWDSKTLWGQVRGQAQVRPLWVRLQPGGPQQTQDENREPWLPGVHREGQRQSWMSRCGARRALAGQEGRPHSLGSCRDPHTAPPGPDFTSLCPAGGQEATPHQGHPRPCPILFQK